MSHHIFTGPFARLESRLIHEIRRLQSGDALAPVNILAGSNTLAAYLKGRLCRSGQGAVNVRFFTFMDLATRLAGRAALADPRPRLPKLGASLILEAMLSAEVPPPFRAVARFTGFRDALLDTFRDLRDGGVTPDALSRALRSGGLPEDRRQHLEGFLALYGGFRERILKFRDVDDDFRDAILNIADAGDVLQGSHLLIYGLYDATGQQSELLSGLKGHLELTYFVPHVDEAVSSFAAPFLRSRARELAAEIIALDGESGRSDLYRLWDRKCGFGPACDGDPTPGADGSVRLLSAPGASRAAVEIVREIVRALGEGLISGFHEAAVVLRHPEDDAPLMAEILRLRGIPYYLHGGVPFAERPLSKAVLALAALTAAPCSRESILGAMELIAAALPEETSPAWEVSEWRALTGDPRFLSGLDAWDQAISGLIEKLSRELAHAQQREAAADDEDEHPVPTAVLRRRLASAHGLRTAWESLRQAADAWPGQATWSDWATLLEDRLGMLFEACEDWSGLVQVIDRLAAFESVRRLGGDGALVPRARLLPALAEAMQTLTLPAGGLLAGGVNLIPVSAARGLRFPLVVVPGLEEGRFPARLRQDPLLLDDERAMIGPGPAVPLRRLRFDEERMLFDMVSRSAERRLVLVTSRLDEGSDRECVPSDFFLRAASALIGRPAILRDLNPETMPGFRSVSLDHPAPAAGQPAVDRAEIRIRLIRQTAGREHRVLRALASAEPQLLERALAFDQARRRPELTGCDGLISDRDLASFVRRQHGPESGPFSVGRIEEYARCPYLFFLRRVMGIAAWEEPDAAGGLDPLERGSAVHRILEEFIGGLMGAGFGSRPAAELRALLRDYALRILASFRPHGMASLLWEIERDRLLSVLDSWLTFELERARDGLIPIAVELPFGPFGEDDGRQGLVIAAGRRRILFRGIIDRADATEGRDRARVIDYKTGRLPDSLNKKGTPLLAGERVQLAVYRAALVSIPGFENLGCVDGEFIHLQSVDGRIVSRSFSAGELEEAARRLPALLEIVADGIDGGVYFARTSGLLYGDRQCDHCDYRPVCGKDRRHREERKAGDPHVLSFNRLREIDEPREDRE